MSDFLLELRSEEIPARMQAGARADLEKLFRKEMDAAGVSLGDITVWSTPRRLALIARGLPAATAAVSEEVKGPRVGAPPQALEGFLRKTGLTEDQLVERDGVLFAVTEKPGRATAEVLAEAIPAIVRAFPWPKSQRWGATSISTESLRWVRPLSAIIALFDGQVVECEVGGIKAGRLTRGHRFHSSGEISIDGVDDYAGKLRAAHVIVDHAERQDLIRAKANEAAAAAGLKLVEDEGLVIENAGLTEWPVPLLGRFDEAFLEVPPEVIQLTARTNQKYFVCTRAPAKAGASGDGAQPTEVPVSAGTQELANAFVCTANIAAADGGAAIVAGNRKVLAARLSDARFFWEQDRKTKLSEHAKKLERITFHEELGTVADKVERVAKLARWLVEEGIVSPREGGDLRPSGANMPEAPAFAGARAALAEQAELAARLCKADLVSEMVGEFPELQGLMGGYYARAEGLSDAVADAIRDHYKPVGQGDEVPTAPVTVAVALADKLDTIFQFFRIDEAPTGSKDPFALRRAGLGAIALTVKNDLRWQIMIAGISALTGSLVKIKIAQKSAPVLGLVKLLSEVVDQGNVNELMPHFGPALQALLKDIPTANKPDIEMILDVVTVSAKVRDFLLDRLEVMVRSDGIAPGLVRAAMIVDGKSGREDDLVRLLARVHALQAFIGTEDGTNLLAGYKRAANILKKEGVVPAKAGTGGDDAPTGQRSRVEPGTTIQLSYTPEPAEKALIDALDQAGPAAAKAVSGEDFAAAMAALASLRAPIDAFFDQVTVNDADPAKRSNRLTLLARFRDAVHGVADFSRIEG